MSKTEKILISALIAYVLIAIITFGHASVRQDRLEAEHKAQCDPRIPCEYWDPPLAVFQSMFWPFYLSYMAWGGK